MLISIYTYFSCRGRTYNNSREQEWFTQDSVGRNQKVTRVVGVREAAAEVVAGI